MTTFFALLYIIGFLVSWGGVIAKGETTDSAAAVGAVVMVVGVVLAVAVIV